MFYQISSEIIKFLRVSSLFLTLIIFLLSMRSKITLKELAKLLNVSVSTVSKALNDSSEISPKTVKRVKELAALHNYRPNPSTKLTSLEAPCSIITAEAFPDNV